MTDAIDRAAVLELAERYQNESGYSFQAFTSDVDNLPTIAVGVKVDAKALEAAEYILGECIKCDHDICAICRELIRLAEAGQDAGPVEAALPKCNHKWQKIARSIVTEWRCLHCDAAKPAEPVAPVADGGESDGGPAFPTNEHYMKAGTGGMTLRDYFAAKAVVMHGAALSTATFEGGPNAWHDKMAELAYATAGALLLARVRKVVGAVAKGGV